jgi:heme-degrading monooxygenase HmoA
MKVMMGKFREFYEVVGHLNDTLKIKGLQQVQMWAPATGAEMNSVVLVTDHESLSDWDEHSRTFQSDPDVMVRWREALPYVEGHPHDELWETAYEIA